MKLLILTIAVAALVTWFTVAHSAFAAWVEVDWEDPSNFTEERLLQIIEGEEYYEMDKVRAVSILFVEGPLAGLPAIKRLLSISMSRHPLTAYFIISSTPNAIEEIGPISRQEAITIFREYCYRLLLKDFKDFEFVCSPAILALERIGDFVAAADLGVPTNCEKWRYLIEESCGKEILRKEGEDNVLYNTRATSEYGAFLAVLMYSACGLDWRAKLAPDAEAQLKIDENIKLLGSDDPEKRKAAREALLKTGLPAYPAIEKAQKDPDPEVRASCDSLISQYPFTIPGRAEGFEEKFHLERDVLLLAALLDIKDEQLHKGAYEKLIKITGAKLADKREEWKKWHAGNAPYAEWDEKQVKWNVVQNAKESQIPLSRWNLIPEEQRKNWCKLDEKVRTQLKEESEKQYQGLLDKEEEDRKKSWPPEPKPEGQDAPPPAAP